MAEAAEHLASVIADLTRQIGQRVAEDAALVGVAPFDEDSGQHHGRRHIAGGRAEVREVLYMSPLAAATRANGVIAAFYRRLRAKGKPPKVALIACLRKLIVRLNAMVAAGRD